jgi:endonuclease YncB( thermonuclease family)
MDPYYYRVMNLKSLIALSTAVLFLATPLAQAETVLKITDGDTIQVNTGKKVRLLQIDTPEPMSSECYSSEATAALTKLISGKTVRLESDPVSANIDQFGRDLRYVFVGKLNINLKMVELGAAAPLFYNGEKGKYWSQLLKAAEKAKKNKVGLWGKCPNAKLDPYKSLSSGKSGVASASPKASNTSQCDPNYSPCIPISVTDLNCPDLYAQGISSIRVIGTDIHKFDRDRDGIACENKP